MNSKPNANHFKVPRPSCHHISLLRLYNIERSPQVFQYPNCLFSFLKLFPLGKQYCTDSSIGRISYPPSSRLCFNASTLILLVFLILLIQNDAKELMDDWNPGKWVEYSSKSTQWELSNEYQHDRVSMIFKNICVLVLWTKVSSALEGFVCGQIYPAEGFPIAQDLGSWPQHWKG